MYPEIIPQVRDAIKRRYEIIPYLYSLALESTLHATPPQRWIGWGYEKDPEVWKPKLLKGEEQYWLGDALMVGGVYEEGLDSARVYLPVNSGTANLPTLLLGSSALPTLADSPPCEGYVNLSSPYQHIPAGQWVTISSPWTSSIPLLAKIGSAIPVGKSIPTTSVSSPITDPEDAEAHLEADDWRGVEIFPPKGSSNGKIWASSWYEDDGLASAEYTRILKCTVTYSCTAEDVSLRFTIQGLDGKSLPQGSEGQWMPLWNSLHVILPIGDVRVVRGSDTIHSAPRDLGNDKQGRKIYVIDGVL
jgi:alpha-glucosidase (family GH31 glycosyl hydrolase)